MVLYSLEELQWAIKGELHGVQEGAIREVATDSRTVSQGRNLLFFALVGKHHNGHNYIETLYKKNGVRRFVISEIKPEFHDLPDASFLFVEDTLKALQQLAIYHRQRFGIPIVAITGSNGKTVVKEWLSQLLSPTFRTHHSPKSYNSQVGVPLSLLGLAAHYEMGVYEAGISEMHEMEKLERIIRPTLGIFTNLGHAHQEGFSNLRAKGEEKMKLFAHAKQLIVCRDQPLVYQLAQDTAHEHGVELITWSTKGASADVMLNLQWEDPSAQLPFTLTYEGNTHSGILPARDAATVENGINALIAACELGLPIETALQGLCNLRPIAMRLERRESINGLALINDSYSCDIESLQIALEFLSQQAPQNPKTLILSDILQSGETSDLLYQRVQRLMEQYGVTHLIGVGPEISSQKALFPNAEFFPTTENFLQKFNRSSIRNSAILIKGSRAFAFERISQILEKRIHRTIMEVDLNALVHNLNHFRALLKPKTKILVLVKAFAYGNGRDELAQLLQFHKVDYLGVAFADEGVALRLAGITLPIIVLNPAPDSYETIIEHQLEPEIFSTTSLHTFHKLAQQRDLQAYPVHIKLDTGMHRLGFTEEELPALCELLPKTTYLKTSSIFTHLATAENPKEDSFTQSQLVRFQTMASQLSKKLPQKPLWHALNSAGIERFPDAQFDMVRLGIGLHGISCLENSPLRPVASLHTLITQIKHLKEGETVGYGRRGIISKPTTIATIPIGYADGYNRKLGQGVGKVLIGGRLCPTIGSICMDSCMVDITNTQANEGDPVTIFGNSPTLQELSDWLNTIPYETLSVISPRVSRVYFSD